MRQATGETPARSAHGRPGRAVPTRIGCEAVLLKTRLQPQVVTPDNSKFYMLGK